MTHRILRLALAIATLSPFLALGSAGCASDSALGCFLEQAAYQYANARLGVLAGLPPDCGATSTEEPGYEPEAVLPRPRADICSTPYEGDDPCVACVRANCCEEILACVREYTCTCRQAKQTPGVDWPEDATCPEGSPVDDAATECLADRCADECPKKQ